MLQNYHNVLNAIEGAAAILDKDGELLLYNKSWEKDSKSSPWFTIEPAGTNYLKHFQKMVELGNDFALRLLLGVHEVLDSERQTFRITITSGTSSKKWYKVTASTLQENQERYALLIFDDISDNMNLIQSLRESEAKYRYQFKYSTSGIILGKSNGELLDVNPVACEMLGYTKQELIEGGRSLIVDESDPAHLEVVRTRDENSIFVGEKEYKHKNGQFIPVQLTSVIYTTNNGNKQIINTFHDLRDEKASRFTLEEERRFSKTALNSIPGIFFVINSENYFVRWNDFLLSHLGYEEDEFVKFEILDIFKTPEPKKIKSITKKAFKTGYGSFIGEIITQDGSIKTFDIHFNKFDNHSQAFLVATGVDITELRESEKKREINYRLLTDLFNNTPIAIVQIDPNNKVQKINQAFTNLFGYTEQQIIGKNVDRMVAAEHQFEEASCISDSAFKGEADQRKTIRFTKDQKEVPVLITTVPVHNNGNIIAVYGMYVDLTEQVQLENNLHKSLTEKELLLQEVHHRVKNNLAIIASLLELQLIHDTEKDAKQLLQQAHDRIYSIAKIHESLYNRTDIAEISFDDYLTSLIEAMPKLMKAKDFSNTLSSADQTIMLNINQAVPLGLLINELVNLNTYEKNIDHKCELSYTMENNLVTLTISGIEHQYDELISENKAFAFQNLLVKTFIDQIEGDIEIEKNRFDKVFVKFQKAEKVIGSSHAFRNRKNSPPQPFTTI